MAMRNTITDVAGVRVGHAGDAKLGSGSTVGAGAYLLNSTFPANTVIPAGAIYVNNKLQGFVQR